MGEKGRTSKSSSGLPSQLKGPLMQQLPGLLDPAKRQGSFASFFMDPAEYGKIGQELGNTAMGGRLNVADTQAGQGMIGAVESQGQKSLGNNLTDLASRFAMSGQGLSGPLMQAQKQAIVENQQNVSDTIAAQLFNQFGQERQLQQNALQGYSQYQQTPTNLYGSLGSMFQRGFQTQPQASPMGMVLGK